VRRSAYNSVGGFSSDYHIIGDFDLVMRLAKNGKMGSFQEPLAFCRKDGNNESILKVDLNIQELKNWSKKNGESYKKTNKKAIDTFKTKIHYMESLGSINNNSFSFTLLFNEFKRQPLINIIKIIIKFIIKKIIGVRV
jgi:hypothetical protein